MTSRNALQFTVEGYAEEEGHVKVLLCLNVVGVHLSCWRWLSCVSNGSVGNFSGCLLRRRSQCSADRATAPLQPTSHVRLESLAYDSWWRFCYATGDHTYISPNSTWLVTSHIDTTRQV